MASRGEIVKKVVQESGISVTRLAQKINISRAQLYIDFSNPEMSFDRILAIGKELNYDFSQVFKDIPAGIVSLVNEEPSPLSQELSLCRDKLMLTQEQLIQAMQELSAYKKKYGTDLTN
ncbi:helix-turn-helix domain-containing protein [Hymenobacter humi]|uniref:Helix-turn-helix domain-containing protein n=1 Tax=Hymenobacter humi TaxID=1411620 RepID=A0ABW2U940_9BACT